MSDKAKTGYTTLAWREGPMPESLTDEELTRLLDHPKRDHPTYEQHIKRTKLQLLMLLFADAGLRAGEAAQLLTTDVYFNCLPTTSTIIRAEIAKSRKPRTIPLSTRLQDALIAYDRAHGTLQFSSKTHPLIHATRVDQPLSTRQIQRIINLAGLRTVGREIHPHVLRHTFATRLMRITNIRTVQELLGHSQLSSTMIYTHPSQEDRTSAIDAISRPVSKQDWENAKQRITKCSNSRS